MSEINTEKIKERCDCLLWILLVILLSHRIVVFAVTKRGILQHLKKETRFVRAVRGQPSSTKEATYW